MRANVVAEPARKAKTATNAKMRRKLCSISTTLAYAHWTFGHETRFQSDQVFNASRRSHIFPFATSENSFVAASKSKLKIKFSVINNIAGIINDYD